MKKYIGTKQIEAEPMRGENIFLEKSRQRKILTMKVIMFVMKTDTKAGRLKMCLKRHIWLLIHHLTAYLLKVEN